METLFRPDVNDQAGSLVIADTYTSEASPIKKLSIIIPAYNEEKTITLIPAQALRNMREVFPIMVEQNS